MILNVYQIHGLLQIIAFGFLFPLGIVIALFRHQIGGRWHKYHVAIQLLAVTLVFIAVTVVHLGKRPPQIKNKTYLNYHKIVGPSIVLLIIAQLLLAFLGHQIIEGPAWLYIHMTLAAFISTLGLLNIYLGWSMIQS